MVASEMPEESKAAVDHDPLPEMFPPLDSTLDVLDKLVTSPFNKIYIGVFEVPLTVVGTWCVTKF